MKTIATTCVLLYILLGNIAVAEVISQGSESVSTAEHNAWLKQKFSKQHEQLIPVVAVADMLYACNNARKVEPVIFKHEELILRMDRDRLAEKLVTCLGEDTMQSEAALNFGLIGCFQAQLADLPAAERQQKMALVEQAILSLSASERKKSFTQCVTQQTIRYLK